MVTRNMLGLVAAVAGGAVLGLLLASQRPSTAVAQQVPFGGSEFAQLVDESKAMNKKMDHLIQLLESGKLEVRVKPDEAKPAR